MTKSEKPGLGSSSTIKARAQFGPHNYRLVPPLIEIEFVSNPGSIENHLLDEMLKNEPRGLYYKTFLQYLLATS